MRAWMSYFHETIWNGVPKFLRRLWKTLGLMNVFLTMPHWFSYLHGWVVTVMVHVFPFCSPSNHLKWISGNPRVTPEVTRDVCACWLEWWLPISTITKSRIWCLRFLAQQDSAFSILSRSYWFIHYFLLGSCLCGVALMSSEPRLMKSTGTQGKMLQNIT